MMIVWRYLPKGRVKHALKQLSVGHAAVAECGTSPSGFYPWSDKWFGTGNQTEYETVEKLPRCKNCVRMLEK